MLGISAKSFLRWRASGVVMLYRRLCFPWFFALFSDAISGTALARDEAGPRVGGIGMLNLRALAAAAAVLCWGGSASALTIDTGNGGNYWSPFGGPDTATYGQTFTVGGPETYLESFSLFLGSRTGGSGPLDLKGYLGVWDGRTE